MTNNSLYQIANEAEGEPPRYNLLAVCHALHLLGIGKMLGVLEVFY